MRKRRKTKKADEVERWMVDAVAANTVDDVDFVAGKTRVHYSVQ